MNCFGGAETYDISLLGGKTNEEKGIEYFVVRYHGIWVSGRLRRFRRKERDS